MLGEVGGPGIETMAKLLEAAWEKGGGEKISLVATGPLTNVALLVAVYGELVERVVEQVVIMGGASTGVGNTSPVAEFNIQMDPTAAAMVFHSCPVPVKMVPLEITHTVLFDDVQAARLAPLAAESPFGVMIADLLSFFAETYASVFGFASGPPLHDPVAVYYLLAPEAFSGAEYYVDVETSRGSLCEGQTVVDRWHESGKKPNVWVGASVDVDAFFDSLFVALKVAAATARTDFPH